MSQTIIVLIPIRENMKSALEDWGLDEHKLVCIATDNSANIVAAIRNLGWPWLNCFGHNLHLAVSHGLDSDKDRTARAIGLCKFGEHIQPELAQEERPEKGTE